ncbi:MAG: hypothetical protein IPP36_01745 [Nitrosomonadales bacterium]|nr:hypothetical protein [Nitrosomonadales bacterium]
MPQSLPGNAACPACGIYFCFDQRPNAQHWGALARTLSAVACHAKLGKRCVWRQRLKLSESLSAD